VREESHLEEMRSAIRGDFERLAERRGDQSLLHVGENEDADEPDAELPEAVEEPEAEERRSWFARFVSP
jgi:hypothetical protein